MLKYKTLLFLLLFSFQLSAQKAEVLHTHFDKPFYVSGEDVWYKIYFKNKVEDIQSGVVHVEWVAPNGRIVERQKLKIIDNYAIGDFAVPYDWKEGNYEFRAFTSWALNFGEAAYVQQVIPIYNLLDTPEEIIEQSTEELIFEDKLWNENLGIKLVLNKAAYQKGDSIELIIKANDSQSVRSKANFSVAVTDGNYLPKSILKTSGIGTIENIRIPSEFPNKAEKSLVLKGQLSDSKGGKLNTRFLSIYHQNTRQFLQTIVKEGNLILELPEWQGTQNLQFFDMNPFHDPLPVIQLTEIKIGYDYQASPLYRSEEVANYLFLLNKFRLYQETFKVASPDYQVNLKMEQQAFDPDKTYTMEKYKGLSDMASFAKEIIPGARVLNKGTDISMRLRYEEKSTTNKLSPWYMINDWLTEDESIVLKLPFREIDQIDMFNSKEKIAAQLDPSMVSRGLLMFYTKDGKTPKGIIQKSNNKVVEGFYPIRTFPQFDQTKNNPDFRPVIYWNPVITTNEKGEAVVRFAASDAVGVFNIRVEGVDTDGNVGSAALIFSVEN